MHRPGRRADAGFALLAVLLLGRLAWLAPRLLVDDLNLDYPFAVGDAWDWIANGLFYAGEDVRYSGRPPLVPLAIAGLSAAGALEWFPVLVQALWTATLLVLYRLLRHTFTAPVAFAATLVAAAGQVLNLLSLEVMADVPAACLLLLSIAALAAAGERPRWYVAAGALAALAALASPVGLAAVAAAVAAVALRRRRHLAEPALWAGGGLVALAVAAWMLARRVLLAGEPPLQVTWRLVRLHGDDLDGILWTAAVVAGWPALALAAAGAVIAARRVARRRDGGELRLLVLVATALPLAFFALLYDFPGSRFLAYSALPGAVLVAEGLAALRPPAVRAAVAAAAVVWAAWPVPVPVPRALLVAPPALYAKAGGRVTPEGGLRVEPAAARLRRRPVTEVARWSWWSRVARAHAEAASDPGERAARRRQRERARRAAAQAEGVLFLDSAIQPFDRYRAQSQLGNLLGRRVRFVPDHLFAGRWRWLAAGGLEPLAEIGGYLLWTVAPPGLEGPWLLATQAGPRAAPGGAGSSSSPAAKEGRGAASAPAAGSRTAGGGQRGRGPVEGPAVEAPRVEPPPVEPPAAEAGASPSGEEHRPFFGEAPPGTRPAPPSDQAPRGRRAAPPPAADEARRLAAALPGRTRRVALLLPDGRVPPLAAWLPFHLETTELYVLDGAAPPVARSFAAAPSVVPRRFGAARLVERRWRGQPVWVIDFPASAGPSSP